MNKDISFTIDRCRVVPFKTLDGNHIVTIDGGETWLILKQLGKDLFEIIRPATTAEAVKAFFGR